MKCGVEIEGQVVCSLCSRGDAILEQRENAKVGLMKQAEKMLALSREKLPPAEIGQNVVVKVPDVDRRRLAPRSVVAVVLSVNESSLYKLGTKEGVLERLYSRNEFTFADSNFINSSDVPSSSLNLRKASALSSGSKQGFVMCHCKRIVTLKSATVGPMRYCAILNATIVVPARTNEYQFSILLLNYLLFI
jgi:hypothetical protein